MASPPLRVLDLSRLLPGPFCSMLLADIGADVIKVEDTGAGDYLRAWAPLHNGSGVMYAALNRNKRSLALDLKDPRGREVFLRLAATADVVIESFRPGVLDRLGIGCDVMLGVRPQLVIASITGYGQDGPYRDRAGHDLNFVGLAGALDPDAPVVPRVQMGDIGGGALMAAVSILAAVLEARSSGVGRHLDVAMLDGLVAWQAAGLARAANETSPGEGDILTGQHPCYAIYPCADGHLTVAALEPKFWQTLISMLDLPALGDKAFAEGADAERTRAVLAERFATRTRAQWREFFGDADVCVEPVNTAAEVANDDQVRARGMVLDSALTGIAGVVASPLKGIAASPWRSPAPAQGEQSSLILREGGYDDATIDTLISEGVIR